MIEAWFDGACEPVNPGGHAAYGAVVHVDGQSVYRDGGYCGFGPMMSNNVAEYSGALAALRKASEYPGVILLRGDSKLVIMQLQGKWKVHGGLYLPYYRAAKQVYLSLKERIRCEWIPREENSICDVLSKQVLKDRGIAFRIQPEKSDTGAFLI